MKGFALTLLLGLIALSCFLAASGQALVREMRRVGIHGGLKLSVFSEAAFALQPWFFLVAFAALVTAGLGFGHKLSERALIYAGVSFLALDIIGLLISLWGVGNVHFML